MRLWLRTVSNHAPNRRCALIRGAIIEATPNQLYSCVQPLHVPKHVKRVDCTVIMTSVGEVPISEDSILLYEV